MNGRTDVTPNGSEVQGVVPPNERVDEFEEASDRGPNDIGTSADVPCLNMPRKRNKNKKETEESKDREERISGIDVHVHGGGSGEEEKKPRRELLGWVMPALLL